MGLPPALGALAAGLILSDNRLTAQIDALVLPYRETFAAVFFVSLGTLMQFDVLAQHPAVCLACLAAVLALKTAAATLALRAAACDGAPRRAWPSGWPSWASSPSCCSPPGPPRESSIPSPSTWCWSWPWER